MSENRIVGEVLKPGTGLDFHSLIQRVRKHVGVNRGSDDKPVNSHIHPYAGKQEQDDEQQGRDLSADLGSLLKHTFGSQD